MAAQKTSDDDIFVIGESGFDITLSEGLRDKLAGDGEETTSGDEKTDEDE